jgi:YfiH family protein
VPAHRQRAQYERAANNQFFHRFSPLELGNENTPVLRAPAHIISHEMKLRDAQKSLIPKYMKFLRFDSMRNIPGLQHAVTTREGGVSGREYSRLNLGFHVGDDENCVRQNRALLADALGYNGSTLVAAQQTHGTNAHIVSQQDGGRGAMDSASAIPNCDALIVAGKNMPVLIQVADCAPILIADEKREMLAVVHAGWRGAVGKIASQTIAKMQSECGTRAQDLSVGIGPCLCADCLEVGEEVAQQAPENCVLHGRAKPHLDLRAIIAGDCATAGVLPARIEAMPDCPRCDNETFFSHRAQGGSAGRFGLVAWWQ